MNLRHRPWGGGGSGPIAGTLSADGPIFRLDGQPWRYRGVTAFKLCELFRLGQDIDGFLDDYVGFNVLRVFSYTPVKDWGPQAWEPPPLPTLLAFLDHCAARGFRVEFTLLTDDDPGRLEPAKRLVDGLAAARPTNIMLEIGNEPDTHKAINTAALRDVCDRSGFLYASGNYENSAKAFGSYLNFHSRRTVDWPRRAHDAKEYHEGGGPNATSDPAHHCPCQAGEPAKAQDVNPIPKDWRAYFGSASILGAGATFHSETGKLGQRPTELERTLASAALEGLLAFPDDAALALRTYRRVVEPGNEQGGPTEESRTYVVGLCMVRCQQVGTAAPEPGWRSLDSEGVLWAR